MFSDYLLDNHQSDLEYIIHNPEIYQHYSINVDFGKLLEADPEHVESIISNPVKTIELCDLNITTAQKLLIDQKQSSDRKFCSVKENVHTRFFGLPYCPDMHRIVFPKNNDLGCFLNVSGTVVRITQSRMLEYKRNYKCIKCHHIQTMIGDYEQRYIIKPPTKCANPIKCRAYSFTPVTELERNNCKDYQELKMQEQVNRLSVGSIPGALWVTLEDDLVDACKPGDDVNICGVVRRRWRPTASNKGLEVELVFHANSIEVCNTKKSNAVVSAPDVRKEFDDFWTKYENSPLQGRNVVLGAVCTQVYGLYMVKLALLLTVITGSNHKIDKDEDHETSFRLSKENNEKSESSVRGQCHLLMVGDPGTGKSQLLKAGAALSSRSVLTSGAGSTRAGLTCTALREEGEWQLEAGALVLSDGGVCCIDEIGQMREHDRTSIHEAMEQQTISIAKAGIVCKLNTRVAVIAACNPKGHYDTDQPLSTNVSLGTPLLSRFDLIFILLDSKNLAWDKLVASYILFGENPDNRGSSDNWNAEKLQLYLSIIGPVQPKMSPVAKMILQAYYMSQRMRECRDPSRTTVRMLDSLVRLSQAHCRLMYRSKVLPVDAITAVSLMDLSMKDYSLPDTIDALHSTFPVSPDIDYLRTAKKLLYNLKLPSIWHEELQVYANILKVDKSKLEKDLSSTDTTAKPELVKDDTINASSEIISTFFKKDNTTALNTNGKNVFRKKSNLKTVANENDKNMEQNLSKMNFRLSQNVSDDDLDAILNLDTRNKTRMNINHTESDEDNNIDQIGKKIKSKANISTNNKIISISDTKIKGKRKRKSCKRRDMNVELEKKLKLAESSGEDDFNEVEALNCLPSVNDFYKNLNINLNDLLMENSPQDNDINKSNTDAAMEPYVSEKLDALYRETDESGNIKSAFVFKEKKSSLEVSNILTNEMVNDKDIYCDISVDEGSQRIEKREAVRPIGNNEAATPAKTSLLKLQQFKFTKRTEDVTALNTESKERKHEIEASLGRVAAPTPQNAPANDDKGVALNSKSSSFLSSQMSIFESGDDFDSLEL